MTTDSIALFVDGTCQLADRWWLTAGGRFTPEEITRYELGYKFARGGWLFAAAAFYSDYRDLQVYRFADDCGCYRIDNAEKAESYGAELRLLAPATDRLTLDAAVAYNHATYEDYVGAGLTGDAVIPTSIGTLALAGNCYYTSEIPMMPANQLSQDAYGLLSLSAQWRSASDKWSVTVFGNNVTDEEYLIFSAAGFLGNNQI